MLSPSSLARHTPIPLESQMAENDEELQSRIASHVREVAAEHSDVDKVSDIGKDDIKPSEDDIMTSDESEAMQEMEKVSDFVKASIPFEAEEEALALFSNSSSPQANSTRLVEEYEKRNAKFESSIESEGHTQAPSSSASHIELHSNDVCSHNIGVMEHAGGCLDGCSPNQEVYTRPNTAIPIPSVTNSDSGASSCDEAEISTKVDERTQMMTEKHGFSWNEILLVQNLIERCLQQHLSKDEIIYTLQAQAKVDPQFTCIVWQKLEEQNESFFRAYAIQSQLREQIASFNYLVYQQKELMRKTKDSGGGGQYDLNGMSNLSFQHYQPYHNAKHLYSGVGTHLQGQPAYLTSPTEMDLNAEFMTAKLASTQPSQSVSFSAPNSSNIFHEYTQSFMSSPPTLPYASPIKTELDTHAFFT
uniref:Uncharacterized protein AlNc14C2G342 n=1 Tax=Albugo laibachii Nc14 TaxID=890382 RepID=F0VZK4_9STRA|nr:conserved unknown protein putative [Albugo laibachii Nc14]|eukprot:CCA14234.1 conserved unknown protein putative [Albugo laibachii Nc14]